jgi:hypothetical protein
VARRRQNDEEDSSDWPDCNFEECPDLKRSAGVLTRSTRDPKPAAGNFKALPAATRCGWDSRAPNNYKPEHGAISSSLAAATVYHSPTNL